MTVQYLTNDNPPPAQSVLQYGVGPDTVFVSTATQPMYADLTITVFNPQSSAVTAQAFRFGFLVGAEYGDLTAAATGIRSSSDQSDWTISETATESPDNPSLYQFRVAPAGTAGLQLAPHQSLVFHLDGILINRTVGEGVAPVVVTEVTGPDPGDPTFVQGAVNISKLEPTLSAQLTVVPPTPVSAGTPVTLSWQVPGSDHWRLYDYDTDTLLYDSETSTPKNALTDGPLYPLQNTNYELIAWAGQLFTVAYAEAMVMAAHFIGEPTATPPVIDPGQQSVLAWETKFASQLTIKAADFQPVVLTAPAGQYDYFPEAPDNKWVVRPTQTTNYSLAITGPGKSSDERYVPVSVNFPQPAIDCFTATPVVFTSGQSITLKWQTSNAFSATLSQKVLATGRTTSLGSVPLIGPGYPVTPPDSLVTYILTVLGQGEATGQLTVAESLGTFSSIPCPSAIAFDGTSLWVSDCNWSLYKMRPSDAAVLGRYTVGGSPLSLVFDGTNIWTANSGGNNVTKVRASDGALLGQYDAGDCPCGIAFDGENIWVTNGGFSGNLIKLRASDGARLGTYELGITPGGVAFDGENIWVAAASENKMKKLLASDGSLLGNYGVGAYPWDVLFDGINIWVTNLGDHTVSKLRPSDGAPLGTFQTGNGPYKILSYASNIWVANNEDGTLSVLDATTGASQGTIPVGQHPQSLACDGTYIWVGDSRGYTLMKL